MTGNVTVMSPRRQGSATESANSRSRKRMIPGARLVWTPLFHRSFQVGFYSVPDSKFLAVPPLRREDSLATRLVDAEPDHLGARRGVPVQWWYYNGHLNSGQRKFSFHAAFFRFDSTGFRIGSWIPLRLLGRNVSFAHLSLTDHETRSTRFSHRRAFRWGICFTSCFIALFVSTNGGRWLDQY